MVVYSLGAKCLSEFLATTMAILMGDSVIANELLPSTKGHGMGFGFISYFFGLAFGLAGLMYGYCSAATNPSVILALWVAGLAPADEFFALGSCQLLGGFVGAVLMYLVYLPHFKTIPEPKPESDDNLLRSRDHFENSALRIASYNTRSTVSHSKPLKDRIAQAKYYLNGQQDAHHVLSLLTNGHVDLSRIETASPNAIDIEADPSKKEVPVKRRHSIQVAYLQKHLREFERESSDKSGDPTNPGPTKEDLLHLAAIKADQAIKLSVFANRPAIDFPLHNFVIELIGTTVLVIGALLISVQCKMVLADSGTVHLVLEPIAISFWVQLCVAALGGPTGFSANSARDIGPRFAHYILPIPGKGPSEWRYSLLINVAILMGGVLAGVLYRGLAFFPNGL